MADNVCLLCFKCFEQGKGDEIQPVGYNKQVLDACVKHLPQIKGTAFHKKYFESLTTPLCAMCYDLADKLLKIEELLDKITTTLLDHVSFFSKEILLARGGKMYLLEEDVVNNNFQEKENNRQKNTCIFIPDEDGDSYDQFLVKDEPPERDVDASDVDDDANLPFVVETDPDTIAKVKDEVDMAFRFGRPRRRAAIVAIENLSARKLKTEPDSNEENSHNDFEDDYNGTSGSDEDAMLMSDESEIENEGEEEPNSKTKKSEILQFTCEICRQTFTRADHWRRHKAVHSDATFDCTQCGKQYENKYKLKEHMDIHMDILLPCNICDKKFDTKNKLTYHKSMKHKERKTYDCTTCGMKLMTAKSLEGHMSLHTGDKPFKCKEESCTSAFTTSIKLKRHFLRAHADIEPTFACDQCERIFKLREDLNRHKTKHTGGIQNVICETCGKVFASKNSLRTHQRNCPRRPREKIYSCEVCNKKFKNFKNLSKHKAVHKEGRKQYECPGCKKLYVSKVILKTHIKNFHSGYAIKVLWTK